MSIETLTEFDKMVVAEANVKSLARVVGYNEVGEPIEIVFHPKHSTYELHVGGDYVGDASIALIQQYCNLL